jgi:hypothetical protein
MHTGLALQYTVIAVVVVVSAAFVLRRQFPNATRKLRIAIALPMLREGEPRWIKAIGRRIAPPARIAGDACGGCNGCDSD